MPASTIRETIPKHAFSAGKADIKIRREPLMPRTKDSIFYCDCRTFLCKKKPVSEKVFRSHKSYDEQQKRIQEKRANEPRTAVRKQERIQEERVDNLCTAGRNNEQARADSDSESALASLVFTAMLGETSSSTGFSNGLWTREKTDVDRSTVARESQNASHGTSAQRPPMATVQTVPTVLSVPAEKTNIDRSTVAQESRNVSHSSSAQTPELVFNKFYLMDMELELRTRHCNDLYNKAIDTPERSPEACNVVNQLQEEEIWAERAEKEIRDTEVGRHHPAMKALRNTLLENIEKHRRRLQKQMSWVGGRIPNPVMKLSGKIVDTSA
ncbi:uncharacterized protein LAESUDRAFT_711018 [Laetiporus sulphureus 93-53]|uniref:Uncharacterized protein n=1 Tax=Laetiporus sulphureus 93-53 TaxID=1314785 RepID=A0A165HCN1_9APHY|nr:uncharacterized protein LAESUDRAFT_711018 [Laetiporus sulphureus 93-53]KZT11552.1 hypothetical protein LAESUDRAFT_711018 [Laetiporus sulphureus 93-53]